MRFFHALFAGSELLLVAFFVGRQRPIRIEINADSGDVTVDDRRLFRRTRKRTTDLGTIAELVLAPFGEIAGDGRKVHASVLDRDGAIELFEATDAEAERGFRFLERAHLRWLHAHPRDP